MIADFIVVCLLLKVKVLFINFAAFKGRANLLCQKVAPLGVELTLLITYDRTLPAQLGTRGY